MMTYDLLLFLGTIIIVVLAVSMTRKVRKDIIGFYPREFYPFDNFSSFAVSWRYRTCSSGS